MATRRKAVARPATAPAAPAPASGDETFDLIEREIELYHVGNRTLSTALLAWFLEAVWRLDPEVASDAICDGGGDKGIDGLHVDDDSKEIILFQIKHRANATGTQGDNDLKTFVGTAGYFETVQSITDLMNSKPNVELQNLIVRLDVPTKIESGEFTVRLVFVTNGKLDRAGADYLASRVVQVPTIDAWDRDRLAGVAARTAVLRVGETQLTLTTVMPPLVSDLDRDVRMAVALVSAPELVRLPGIDDLSIFELNVRLGLGRTRINKQLADTIRDKTEHQLFVTYHNGMTLLTRKLEVSGSDVKLTGVSVVNGCQSLLALYANRTALTPALQVLVRIVELGTQGDLVDRITYRTNNQNAVNIRDQRSTDKVQRDLQAHLSDEYGDELSLAIRNGEQFQGPVIENAFLAQMMMATYIDEPWNAVRKVRLFDEDYHRIFSRILDAHKIMLLHLIDEALLGHRAELNPALSAAFSSVRFTLANLVVQLISLTEEGKSFLDEPAGLLAGRRTDVTRSLSDLAIEAIDSTNHFVESKEAEALEAGQLFDPKVAFKSRTSVMAIQRDAIGHARRAMRRDDQYGFRVSTPTTKARSVPRTSVKKQGARRVT